MALCKTAKRDRLQRYTPLARGGGVAVYVRVGLKATRVALFGALEAVCIQVHLGHRRVVDTVAVYLPLLQFIRRQSLKSEQLRQMTFVWLGAVRRSRGSNLALQ